MMDRQYGFFSTLAKVVNLWRDHARPIMLLWERMFTTHLAMKHAASLPSRCVAGRWGSIQKAEGRVDDAGKHMLTPVFETLLNKKAMMRVDAGEAIESPGPDELRVEEQRAFAEQTSRWARESLVSLRDCLFWAVLKVMRACHGPYTHHLACLQKTPRYCGRGATWRSSGAVMLWQGEGNASKLSRIVKALFVRGLHGAASSQSERAVFLECVPLLVLHHAAAYNWRVVENVERCPLDSDCRLDGKSTCDWSPSLHLVATRFKQ